MSKRLFLALALCLSALVAAHPASSLADDSSGDDGHWQPVTGANAPSPRGHHTAIWTGSEMIVWGGMASLKSLGDGKRYTPAMDLWRDASPSGIPARNQHTAAWTGSHMVIWGGNLAGWDFLSDGNRYNPVPNVWAGMAATELTARWWHTAVWTGSEMIVWGGGNAYLWVNDGGRYDPQANSWRDLSTTNAPSPRTKHTAVWTGQEMIVWGGWRTGALNDGGRYDPAKDIWNDLAESLLAGRCRHTAIWTGDEMIIWGGWDGKDELGDGARYSPPPRRIHLPIMLRNHS